MPKNNTAWEGVTALNIGENIEDPNIENILRAMYEGLYSASFPLESEREAIEDLIKRALDKDRNPRQFITIHFTDPVKASELANQIAQLKESYKNETNEKERLDIRKNISDIQKEFTALTVGFVIGEVYRETETALINYVVRNQDFSKKYPAKDMVDHQVDQYKEFAKSRGEEISLIAWEANHKDTPFFDEKGRPNLAVDVMDSNLRIEVLEKTLKATNINFNYAQPPLSTSQEICELLLYSYPVGDGVSPEKQVAALEKFMNKFYSTFPEDGKFKSDEKGSSIQKFAEDCEIRKTIIEQIVGDKKTDIFGLVLKNELSIPSQNLMTEEVLPKARELSSAGKIEELKDFISATFSDAAMATQERIFHVVLSDLGKELATSAEVARGMVSGLEALKKDPSKFYGEPQLDAQAVKEGREKMAKYRAEIAEEEKSKPKEGATRRVVAKFEEASQIPAQGVVAKNTEEKGGQTWLKRMGLSQKSKSSSEVAKDSWQDRVRSESGMNPTMGK